MYGDLRQDVIVGGRGLDGLRGGGAVPAGRLVPRSLALVGPRVFPKVVLAIETWKINKYLSTFLLDLCNFLTGSHILLEAAFLRYTTYININIIYDA